MLFTFVGLTAIDVSLCGPVDVVSQSVFACAALCTAVVQIAVPVFTAGPEPNVALGTGAGASNGLCVKSTGCGSSSANAATLTTNAATRTTRITAESRAVRLLILPPHRLRTAGSDGWLTATITPTAVVLPPKPGTKPRLHITPLAAGAV